MHHINKMKGKTISIDAEKAFDKIQPLHEKKKKTPDKLELEGSFLN